ncbi:MAG: DUF555 domain-containing protein [Euryarchaeota archaeon]|nr:DUF555 domain-containing protein [Euryarchaeota archaeon]
MPNFKVLLEGAWLVRDVKTVDDAIGVAISESGKRLNKNKLEFVEVEVGQTICPNCDESLDGVFLVAGTALVGLLFEIKVYDADGEEHAARIAKSMIGKALRSIPLRLVEVADLDPADQRPVRSG